MPPKLFKIKKADTSNDDDNKDDLVISDYQKQRLDQQSAQAEAQHSEEQRRAAAAEGEAVATTAVGAKAKVEVKPEGGDGKADMSRRVAGKLTANAVPRSSTAAAAATSQQFGTADVLPKDTMDAILGAPTSSDGHYQPMMLAPLTANLTAPQAENGGLVMMNAPGANGTLTASPPQHKSGTAFLEEGHREKLAAYAANKDFFGNNGINAPKQSGDNDNADNLSEKSDDAVMLMQLPRPIKALASSCSLDQMAPGRIGKMTVYKSGRTTMTIGGVTVDVAFEPHREADGTSSTSAQASEAEGISQFAVAVDSNDLARRGCYQLCWIPRKVVCTPQLEDE